MFPAILKEKKKKDQRELCEITENKINWLFFQVCFCGTSATKISAQITSLETHPTLNACRRRR